MIDIANSVDIKIKNHELDLMEYLRYMSDDLGVLKVNNLHNGLFITAKLGGDDY